MGISISPQQYQIVSPQIASGLQAGSQMAGQISNSKLQQLQAQLIQAGMPYAAQQAQQELYKTYLANQMTKAQVPNAGAVYASQGNANNAAYIQALIAGKNFDLNRAQNIYGMTTAGGASPNSLQIPTAVGNNGMPGMIGGGSTMGNQPQSVMQGGDSQQPQSQPEPFMSNSPSLPSPGGVPAATISDPKSLAMLNLMQQPVPGIASEGTNSAMSSYPSLSAAFRGIKTPENAVSFTQYASSLLPGLIEPYKTNVQGMIINAQHDPRWASAFHIANQTAQGVNAKYQAATQLSPLLTKQRQLMSQVNPIETLPGLRDLAYGFDPRLQQAQAIGSQISQLAPQVTGTHGPYTGADVTSNMRGSILGNNQALQEAANRAQANQQNVTQAFNSQGSTQNYQPAMSTPVQMPKFNSKAEFQSWYSSLSPQQKMAARAQLGGK